MLGNIRFIGELGKLEVVNEGILHKCIQQLLEKKRRGLSLMDQAEDLECLCQIMKTVGKRLDTPKAKLWMDQYFERMASIQRGGEMPSRIRFMIQDVLDLRENAWEPRRVAKELLPQTIGQIRQGFPGNKVETSLFGRPPAAANNADADLVDLFGVPMARKSIGVGPGVIQDTFRPSSPSGNRHYYNRQDQSTGWKESGRERAKRDWEMYGERDQNMRADKETKDKYDANERGRDFQPRFISKNLSAVTSSDKLSLRPGASVSKNPTLKPSSPHQLPKSARSSNAASATESMVRESPIFTKPQTPVIIKQEPKPKTKKQTEVKSTPDVQQSKASQAGKANQLLEMSAQLWQNETVQETCEEICDLFKNLELKTLQPNMSRKIIQQALKAQTNRLVNINELFVRLLKEGYLDHTATENILSEFLDELPVMEMNYENIKLQAAELLAAAVFSDVIDLATICKLLDGGKMHPLPMEFLNTLLKKKGDQWLIDSLFQENISCVLLLPESVRSYDKALEILDKYGLSDTEPMLKIQKQLWIQINEDPNPATFFKWIMKNIEEKYRDNDEFTHVLFKSLLRYIANETSMRDGIDIKVLPDRSIQEQEKTTFAKYQDIMLRFLHESYDRQMTAIYSLQVFCNENNFPKGMMLRMFTYLYDLEIVEEEVFMKWKEDLNEHYPGKGKALFQVNQWLTWLEQAESESDEGED